MKRRMNCKNRDKNSCLSARSQNDFQSWKYFNIFKYIRTPVGMDSLRNAHHFLNRWSFLLIRKWVQFPDNDKYGIYQLFISLNCLLIKKKNNEIFSIIAKFEQCSRLGPWQFLHKILQQQKNTITFPQEIVF